MSDSESPGAEPTRGRATASTSPCSTYNYSDKCGDAIPLDGHPLDGSGGVRLWCSDRDAREEKTPLRPLLCMSCRSGRCLA